MYLYSDTVCTFPEAAVWGWFQPSFKFCSVIVQICGTPMDPDSERAFLMCTSLSSVAGYKS